jgi:hypothetical protein
MAPTSCPPREDPSSEAPSNRKRHNPLPNHCHQETRDFGLFITVKGIVLGGPISSPRLPFPFTGLRRFFSIQGTMGLLRPFRARQRVSGELAFLQDTFLLSFTSFSFSSSW